MTRPMHAKPLKDKAEIEAFLRTNPELHIYGSGRSG